MKRIFLIDGSHTAYRAHFAFRRNPLLTSAGENVSAVFGFTNSLMKIIRDEKPDYLGVVFDRPEPTFRHKLYGEYKATREQMPEELIPQISHIKEIVEAFNVPLLELPGYEADDIMATFAVKAEKEGIEVYLVTGDKDMMQLVSRWIKVYKPGKSASGDEIMGTDEVEKKFGVKPSQIRDFLALMGDASDNIPGIRGIGEKRAAALLKEHGDLKTLLEHTDKITSKSDRKKVEAGKESALMSQKLVTLETAVPLSHTFNDLKVKEWDDKKLRQLYKEFEFNSLLKQLGPSQESGAVAKELHYSAVTTKDDLRKLCDALRNTPRGGEKSPWGIRRPLLGGSRDTLGEGVGDPPWGFAVDLETTELDPMLADIVGYSFSFREGEGFYVPVMCPSPEAVEFSPGEAMAALKPILEDPEIKKCGQNAKFDMLVLRRAGVRLKGLDFDTMVAAYLINPDSRRYSLDSLADEYYSYIKIPIADLIGKGKNQRCMDEVPLELITRYACEDADFTFRLKNTLGTKIRQLRLDKLMDEVETPLIPVLEEMEYNGVTLDIFILEGMSKDLNVEIAVLEKEIYDLAGESFNINSPQQLGKILFEKLEVHKKIGRKRVRKTKTGYATNVDVLEQLVHKDNPIIQKILDYRKLAKLKTTYVAALPELVNPHTGRIHTSYNQTIAATGRLSSSNPNLQNIPIRSQRGREIRKAFIPRKEGWVILSADYSQIELRLAAHFSKDKALIESFQKGEDIHTRTASLIFNVNQDEVTPEMRYRAKAINFGIIYGMGHDRLAREVDISREEAREFIDAYFINYPGVNEYIVRQISHAREQGYVTTLFDRRRYLPDLNSDNQQRRNAAENAAVNTPIQGTAADIIKKAMINLHDIIKKEGLSAKMILQIHDELVFELPEEELDLFKNYVTQKMEHAAELLVPVKVDIGVGANWFEAH